MIMIQVIDDFLDQSYIDYLDFYCCNSISWEYKSNLTDSSHGEIPWQHGISKLLHDATQKVSFDKTGSELFLPAVLKIEETFGLPWGCSCFRARLDMSLRAPEPIIHEIHRDWDFDHYACILYLNDADGDTIIYNETTEQSEYTVLETISPKKNRLVFFDGLHYHTGNSPIKNNRRLLMNINFVPPK